MLRSMSSDHLLEWYAYADLEPFDETRADLRAASIVSILANVHRDRTQHPKPFAVEDCTIRVGDARFQQPPVPPPRQQTAADIEKIMSRWVRASNQALKENPHASQRRIRRWVSGTSRSME